MKLCRTFVVAASLLLASVPSLAEIERVEISNRESLSDAGVNFSYESITGIVYFSLDPNDEANTAITDIEYAPVNDEGLVEYSADFRVLVPSDSIANGGLLYNVNNRGGKCVPTGAIITTSPQRNGLHLPGNRMD